MESGTDQQTSVRPGAAVGAARWAASWLAHGIRVNAVIPGYTETPLVQEIAADAQRRDAHLATVPMGRAGRPEDVDGIMVYLASDESSYATGALFTVDGGYTAV